MRLRRTIAVTLLLLLVAGAVSVRLGTRGSAVRAVSSNSPLPVAGGTTGASPANDRKKGFAEGIVTHPGITVVRSESALFSMAKAKEVMEALVQTLGADGFDAVYAHNDDMALGALQVLKERGLDDKVKVMGVDGLMEAVKTMESGEYAATALNDPAYLGKLAVTTALEVADGKAPAEDFVDAGTTLVTPDNAKEFVGSSLFAQYENTGAN